MRLRLTYRDGDSATDVVLTTDAGAAVGAVARHLAAARRRAVSADAVLTLAVNPGTTLERVVPASTVVSAAGIRSGDVVALAADGGRFRPAGSSDAPAASLQVLSGPDAGRTFPLQAGSNVVGRDRDCDVRLADPLVSKRHARINVSDVVEIIDVGSSNGIVVDGELVPRSVMRPGQQVELGDTTVVVVTHQALAATPGQGAIAFNRSPRLSPCYEGTELRAPEPPKRPEAQRLPLIGMLAPLAMGGVIFAVTRSLTAILFVALSPLMLIGSALESRINGRRSLAAATKDFRSRLADLAVQMQYAHGDERERRGREHPSATETVRAAHQRTPLLWTRRPEHDSFLDVRLGLGTLPSRNTVSLSNLDGVVPELLAELEAVVHRFHEVERVPVTARLAHGDRLGVAGPESTALGVARGLVAQLVALHSPAELAVAGLGSAEAASRWDWLKWLPHVGSDHSPLRSPHLAASGPTGLALLSELEELVDLRAASRTPGEQAGAPLPHIVVLVDDGAPVDRARLVELCERGPEHGVHLVWMAPSVERLPAACNVYLELDATGGAVVGVLETGRALTLAEIEPIDAATTEAFARSLAPVVDSGARVDGESELPQSVSFLSLAGLDVASSPNVIVERWRESGSLPPPPGAPAPRRRAERTLRALVGSSSVDLFHLDLRTHGPHALVGGTTGSGKSEFLQSWILGMASAHSPTRVTFLFVDYKGGAAFAECVHLPHTVGLVTDLSPHLVQRALASLKAELRHREHVLNRHKAKDLAEMERRGDPAAPPSLVIVVDEFAALATEVPEFVEGVVDVAQRGRSLGLHLILATQRPAGVIKDNLRANTNLRIALRMADEADSVDVVGTAQAAAFDPSLPGRAIAKTGPGRLIPFQSSYVGGWTSERPPEPKIAVEELRFGPPVLWEVPETDVAPAADGPTDIARIVATIRAAATAAQLPVPRPPWLPELAREYNLATLPTNRTDAELVFGVRDVPQDQSQPTVAFHPDRDGNMAVFGTGGTGKSTFLRTLAIAAGYTVRGGPCLVYALDFAGRSMQMLEALPHVGAVIGADDHERAARLLRQLRAAIDERALRYAASGAGSISDYRARSGRTDEPRLLLLVDGIGAFRQAYESTDKARLFDMFLSIAGEGRQFGVHVVVSADQPGAVPSGLGSAIQRRLVLRLANENDYGLLGVPHDVLSVESPPGRGLFDGDEVQVAVLGGDATFARQSAAVERLAATAAQQPNVVHAPGIDKLAERIDLAQLPVHVGGEPVLGVSDETLQPVGFEPAGTFLVTGGPQSGRTSTVATMVLSLDRWRPGLRYVFLGPPRSPLLSLRSWDLRATTVDEAADIAGALARELESAPPGLGTVIVVEGLNEYLNSMAEDGIQALVKVCRTSGNLLIAEAETTTITSSWALYTAVKSGRRGIVLQPDQTDGDTLFNVPFPRMGRAEFPPGRGMLVRNARPQRVQVALPVVGGVLPIPSAEDRA